MGVIKKSLRNESTISKDLKINTLKIELALCKIKIKQLQSTSAERFKLTDKLILERDLEVELQRKEVLKRKLAELGTTEKRGRPRKNDSEKYSTIRSKFTAMLLPKNLSYLNQLKDTKKIKNISDFLDELIENHRNNN